MGSAIFRLLSEFTVDCDASTFISGVECKALSTEGQWTPQEQSLHISALELLASYFAVKSFARDKINICIRLHMDKVSTVCYVSHLLFHLGKTSLTLLDLFVWNGIS